VSETVCSIPAITTATATPDAVLFDRRQQKSAGRSHSHTYTVKCVYTLSAREKKVLQATSASEEGSRGSEREAGTGGRGK
jgi:hypothetical protein